MQESDKLFATLEPLLSEAGLALIELSVSRKGGAQVKMSVYSPKGTGTDECIKASRIAYIQAQTVLGDPDPSIEVSSPGIDRMLRSLREWTIFKGKGVRVLFRDETEWEKGRIVSVQEDSVTIAFKEGDRLVRFEDIAKARLDSSQEGD